MSVKYHSARTLLPKENVLAPKASMSNSITYKDAGVDIEAGDELVERIRDLEQQGLRQLMFLPSVVNQYRLVETFARKVMARL